MKAARLLGSSLVRLALTVGECLRAFLRFTEEDAYTLLSAHGFHVGGTERVGESRSGEPAKNEGPKRARYGERAPSFGSIPAGWHQELIGITFGTASRKHLHRWVR
jgi:hypothetical protein